MERIPIEQVPEEDKACEKWMYDMYEKKVMSMLKPSNHVDSYQKPYLYAVQRFKILKFVSTVYGWLKCVNFFYIIQYKLRLYD